MIIYEEIERNGKEEIGTLILYANYEVKHYNIHNNTPEKKPFGYCDFRVLPELKCDLISLRKEKKLIGFSMSKINSPTMNNAVYTIEPVCDYSLDEINKALTKMFPENKRGDIWVD